MTNFRGPSNFPAPYPLLMTLKQLREYVPERKNLIEADNLNEIKPTTETPSLKQPNKLSVSEIYKFRRF